MLCFIKISESITTTMKKNPSYTTQLIKEPSRPAQHTEGGAVRDPGHLVERSEPGFQQSIQTGEMDLQLDKSINSPVGTS